VLAPQDVHLMSKGNELEFQGGAASEAESEDGNDGDENRDHAHNSTDMARKSLGSRPFGFLSKHRSPLQGDVEPMTEKQILGFKPAPRLEQAGDIRSKQV